MQVAEDRKHEAVTVTVTIDDPEGGSTNEDISIPSGSTPVTTLKQELGVPAEESLFLVREGKRQLLADHEHHNVKAGDHYEYVGKGGVS
jgi:hypothetical protein